jgi:hypothetical protein
MPLTFLSRLASRRMALLLLLAAALGVVAHAQRAGRGGRAGGGGALAGALRNLDAPGNNYGYGPPPADIAFTINPTFRADTFTFARLRYGSGGGFGGGGRRGGGGRWSTDVPMADWSLAFRLHQMTSLNVSPGLHFVDITPEQLARYPFVYMIEPGGLSFTRQEATDLRKYLLNGGFMMVDDFWGEVEWEGFYSAITDVFPELPRRLPQNTSGANLEGDIHLRELSIEHPIFHEVFDLKAKPQMPGIGYFRPGGPPYERSDATQVHYKGIFDKKGRLMVIICHNTDLGDGWEREGENYEYFKTYAEPMAYPMMINILFYAMSH